MNVPKDLKYTRDHEWARVDGDAVSVGITDFAQEKLGSIVFVELPGSGKTAKKGETLVTVDSVKAVAEVYAPISGEVRETNEALKDNPELINREPYGGGWMVKMKIAAPGEIGTLLSPGDYEAFLAEEEAKG